MVSPRQWCRCSGGASVWADRARLAKNTCLQTCTSHRLHSILLVVFPLCLQPCCHLLSPPLSASQRLFLSFHSSFLCPDRLFLCPHFLPHPHPTQTPVFLSSVLFKSNLSLYLMKGTFLFFSWPSANWLYCCTSSYWWVYVRKWSKELTEMFSWRFILMPPPWALFILPAQSIPLWPESTFVFIGCFGVQCLPHNRCLGKTGSSIVTPSYTVDIGSVRGTDLTMSQSKSTCLHMLLIPAAGYLRYLCHSDLDSILERG